jgi:hypothetical protein
LIGIAVINALSNKKTSYAELIAVNVAILGGSLVMERVVRKRSKSPKANRIADSKDAGSDELASDRVGP